MATEVIPTYNSLTDVYGTRGCKEAIERYAKLNETFQQLFGTSPEAFARSPGRVNLIGEHIDYEGYAVLPMAIRQDTVVAIRRSGATLELRSTVPEKYANCSFSTNPAQAVDVDNHCWGNYFVAAYKGVFEHWQSKQGGALPVTGLQVLVDGNVPTAAGLSSSSALVCACALAVLGVHGQSLTKSEVAEFTCTCERYVGVTSGGMDQAISIMASPGTAKMVEFAPVRATDVQLPAGATFVVANSLAVSAKADTAAGRYNLRVLECRLAAAVLGKQLGAAADRAAALKTLLEVEPLAEAWWTGSPASRSEVCCHAAQQLLHEDAYGEAEVESAIGMPLTQLLSDSPVSLASVAVARERGGFRLRQRALHVYGEAARVHAFRKACNVHSSADASATMETLGRLMDESHGSCSQLYECSCPELEELVSVCRSAGALGSRLTGAGWGGCTVSLVREEDAEAFISAVKQRYYQPLVEKGIASTDLLDLYVFASQPAGGGAVLQLPAEAPEAAQ